MRLRYSTTLPKAKFDETVELYAHLTVDPRKSDQMVRGTLQLPHGSGKTVRVIVFTERPEEALELGAEAAGLDDLIEKVSGGWTDFDVAIATSSAMKSVRKVARVLGPKGLMPNPKSGTVSDDIRQRSNLYKVGVWNLKWTRPLMSPLLLVNVHLPMNKLPKIQRQLSKHCSMLSPVLSVDVTLKV